MLTTANFYSESELEKRGDPKAKDFLSNYDQISAEIGSLDEELSKPLNIKEGKRDSYHSFNNEIKVN
jgi:hypothetical protein